MVYTAAVTLILVGLVVYPAVKTVLNESGLRTMLTPLQRQTVREEYQYAAEAMRLEFAKVQHNIPDLSSLGFRPFNWSFDPHTGIAAVRASTFIVKLKGNRMYRDKDAVYPGTVINKILFLRALEPYAWPLQLTFMHERTEQGLDSLQAASLVRILKNRGIGIRAGEEDPMFFFDTEKARNGSCCSYGTLYMLCNAGLHRQQSVMTIHKLQLQNADHASVANHVSTERSVLMLPHDVNLSTAEEIKQTWKTDLRSKNWIPFRYGEHMYFITHVAPQYMVCRLPLATVCGTGCADQSLPSMDVRTVEQYFSEPAPHATLQEDEAWHGGTNLLPWTEHEWLVCVHTRFLYSYAFLTISRDPPFRIQRATPKFRFAHARVQFCRDIWRDEEHVHCAVSIEDYDMLHCRFSVRTLEALLR